MSLNIKEIKEQSAQLFAREKLLTAMESTPLRITEPLEKFCVSLSVARPDFVPVLPDEHGIYGWCSDGVAQKIKFEGGSHCYGWTIWEWPDVLWTAEFHDVWVSLDNNLIDITPKPAGEVSILFLPDHNYGQDFDFNKRPSNRLARAYQAPDPITAVRSQISSMKPSQLSYEQKRAKKAELSVEDWLRSKVEVEPLQIAIDRYIAACEENYRVSDSSGIAGRIEISRDWQRSAQNRNRRQNALFLELKKTRPVK